MYTVPRPLACVVHGAAQSINTKDRRLAETNHLQARADNVLNVRRGQLAKWT